MEALVEAVREEFEIA